MTDRTGDARRALVAAAREALTPSPEKLPPADDSEAIRRSMGRMMAASGRRAARGRLQSEFTSWAAQEIRRGSFTSATKPTLEQWVEEHAPERRSLLADAIPGYVPAVDPLSQARAAGFAEGLEAALGAILEMLPVPTVQ